MSQQLKDILYGVTLKKVVGSTDVHIQELTADSRTARPKSVFFAVKGTQTDGHAFIAQAINNGCQVVVAEKEVVVSPTTTLIVTDNTQKAMGIVAHNFYQQPSKQLILIGITGTNGKTTSVTLLHDVFTRMGKKTGLLSTVVNKINQTPIPSTHTTPNALELNRILKQMVDEQCTHCFMEVSSHAIDQDRIAGLLFSGAVFTNITHDHLDYHRTFKNYVYAKKRFFDNLSFDAFALINADDKNASVMVQNSPAKKITYAKKSMADYTVKVLENQFSGLKLNLGGTELWSPLVGEFNAYNLLAVYAMCDLLLPNLQWEILRVLSSIAPVNGRFEHFVSKNGVVVIVDYAHTPDALENVLKTIDAIRTKNETLYTIIGCGGDRDKEKRPEMARIACEYSDRVIFTSDNPRTEDPNQIIEEMYHGVPAQHFKKTLHNIDRRQAIQSAVFSATNGDIILIAGKGHEKYQEINGVKYDFDDRQVATELSSR